MPTVTTPIDAAITAPATSERAPALMPLLRLWTPIAAMVALLLAVTQETLRPLSDPDTWWHLRLGEEFWGSWTLADPGQLSPFATRPWFATQWIPEVVASKFEEYFGLPGVAWLFGTVVVALIITIFIICRWEGNALSAALATTLCVLGAGGSLSARPQLVSFLLLVVTTGAWLRTSRDLHARWWLIPLTWFWACSHGMWLAGVAVGIAVTMGLALDKRLGWGSAAKLLAVPVASVSAAALTPVGPQLLIASRATQGMAQFVTEWAAPSFQAPGPAVTMLMICAVVVTWARRGRVPWSHLTVLILATGWTLLSARTVALGAVMAAPLFAAAVHGWLRQDEVPAARRTEWVGIAAGGLACLAWLAVAVPTTAAVPGKVPNGLNSALDNLPAKTVVLNEYALGGWLTWRHRDLAPVVDGMTDGYTVGHVAEYMSASSVEAGWRNFVTRTDPTYALLEKGSPLAVALVERLEWQPMGSDKGYVLLTSGHR